ncbi:YafY family protein [Arthrobacter sp. Y-9]|uniref:helix-turn-helix transcriptional regulator n=1 Tax=Arthrobacter sp. Y-9 TaxID=3039385 RepID=UPI00241FA35D|nr:YafY family protein [Arthrobacter sp. Y-9]WFR84253.1 YafY family protein [Arthrobacter sp. Y-9]
MSLSVLNEEETENMANTSSRTLRLLSLLQARRYWPGAELAGRLEVSVRTLRRDVERLRDLGYPVEAARGVDGGYQLASGAAMPPLLLDDEEAVALAIALRSAAQGAVSGVAEASVRALAKLVQVMPRGLRRRVEAIGAATESHFWEPVEEMIDPELLIIIGQACRDRERIGFDYTAADGRASTRHVEPLRMVRLGLRWYLVCYDLDRGDWRSFRLDRMSRPVPTGARFAPRTLPAENPVAFIRDRADKAPGPQDVVALVAAPEREVTERIGRWATASAVSDGSCRVTVHAKTLDWALLALGMLDADFTIESPRTAIDGARARGERLIRASGSQPLDAGR